MTCYMNKKALIGNMLLQFKIKWTIEEIYDELRKNFEMIKDVCDKNVEIDY